MDIEHRFIAKVHNLSILDTLNKGINCPGGFRMTNNITPIKSWLQDRLFLEQIGALEADSFQNSTYVYSKKYAEELYDPIAVIDHYFMHIAALFQFMWFVKDNAIKLDYAFLHRKSIAIESVSNNVMFTDYYKADGSKSNTMFNKTEIERAIAFGDKFNNVLIDKRDDVTIDNIYTEASRLDRSFYFLQNARSAREVPMKITNYCISLETLLATRRTEISDQLCERIVLLMKEDYTSLIKKAYNVRSHLVHGDTLARRLHSKDEQIKLSVQMDDLMRKLFVMIIEDDELSSVFVKYSKEKLADWFDSEQLLNNKEDLQWVD
jgi:hypothetical protein